MPHSQPPVFGSSDPPPDEPDWIFLRITAIAIETLAEISGSAVDDPELSICLTSHLKMLACNQITVDSTAIVRELKLDFAMHQGWAISKSAQAMWKRR